MNPTLENNPLGNPTGASAGNPNAQSTGDMGQKVREAGEALKEKLSGARNSSANTLERAASSLREKAAAIPGGETTSKFARNVADKMEATADYIRRSDFQCMKTDAENVIRRHPGQSLLAAIAGGFLLGRVMRRRG